jgi:small subunit ribosomal protein S1
MKQLGGDPWANLIQRFPEGKRMKGTVTNVADYGCFVEIEEGVEGLVHCSEMDWTNKNATPSKIVQVGQEVEVMVLDVDEDRRRISLGLKQCQANPWDKFAETVKKGDKVKGAIRSITDFGVFVGLEGGIDGLIHLSDLSWDKPGEEAVRDFNKGDDIETIILAIDVERERISLGVKQLANDPHADFNAKHERGAIMKGTVAEVTAEGATLDIGDAELKGYIRASDISRERVSDATKHFKVGDEVEARFMGIDRKNNMAGLSIRALEDEHEKVARKKLAEADDAQPTTTLGDLIKEKMGDSKK